MFPTMEKKVLHMVLESNGGHMEATIACLLQMNDEPKGKPAGGASQAPAASQITITSGSSPENKSSPSPSHGHAHQAAPALPPKQPRSAGSGMYSLPDDFLRPPSFFKSQGPAAGSSGPLSQMDQDAMLAAMLQDDLFMQDLMKRPDVYMVPPRLGPPVVEGQVVPPAGGAGSSASGSGSGGSNVSEKFSNLGSAAKAKIAEIAARFKRSKTKGGGLLNPNTQYRDLDLSDEGRPLTGDEPVEMSDRNKKPAENTPEM